MRYENPDTEVARHTRRKEGIVGRRNDGALLGVRLTVIPREWHIPFYRSVPKVIRRLDDKPFLTDYGVFLRGCPEPATDQHVVKRPVELLDNDLRSRPVIVMNVSGSNQPLIDADPRAQKTAGIAHVFIMRRGASRLLTGTIRVGLYVYRELSRTIHPRFVRYSARFNEHLLVTQSA